MRAGYRLEQRGESGYEFLIAPKGERVAWVDDRNWHNGQITVRSLIVGIESREVMNGAQLRSALDDISEEHYQLTTTRQQRFHDRLNKWADYPILKLVGIAAAIVAAAASVLALVRELST